MCRCDKAELPPPRLPLALWLAAAHGSPVFFPFSFCPSLCCGRASPPSTSSADSGVACRPEAANLPAPDLRQQVLAAITIRRLRLTLRSTHLATVEFCCCISLQPPSHSSDRRNKGQPLKLLKPLPNRLSKPPSSPPARARAWTPASPHCSSVSTTIHLAPGGVRSGASSAITSSPHVTWTNRCATTLNLALRIPILPHLFFSCP